MTNDEHDFIYWSLIKAAVPSRQQWHDDYVEEGGKYAREEAILDHVAWTFANFVEHQTGYRPGGEEGRPRPPRNRD